MVQFHQEIMALIFHKSSFHPGEIASDYFNHLVFLKWQFRHFNVGYLLGDTFQQIDFIIRNTDEISGESYKSTDSGV